MMKKILLIFVILGVLVYPKTNLRKETRLRYDELSRLIRVNVVDKHGKTVNDTRYHYDERYRVKNYESNSSIGEFYYDGLDRVRKIIVDSKVYNFYYIEGEISKYQVGDKVEVASRGDSREVILEIYDGVISSFKIERSGRIRHSKVRYTNFEHLGEQATEKYDEHDRVIRRVWEDKGRKKYHIKYYEYDSRGNIVKVKEVDKTRVVRSLLGKLRDLSSK